MFPVFEWVVRSSHAPVCTSPRVVVALPMAMHISINIHTQKNIHKDTHIYAYTCIITYSLGANDLNYPSIGLKLAYSWPCSSSVSSRTHCSPILTPLARFLLPQRAVHPKCISVVCMFTCWAQTVLLPLCLITGDKCLLTSVRGHMG